MANLTVTLSSTGGKSGGPRKVWSASGNAFAELIGLLGVESAKNMKYLFNDKIGKDALFIWGNVHMMVGMISSVINAAGFKTIQIEKKDFDKIVNVPAGVEIVWCNYMEDDFLDKMIANGSLKPHHWTMSMGKKDEAVKEYYRKNSKFIEMWRNVEMQSGFKFPDCSTFHYVAHGYKKDKNNEFIDDENNCQCGLAGKTFSVRPTKN